MELKKPMGSGWRGFHDAQLDSLRYRLPSARAYLRGHGNPRMAVHWNWNLAEVGPNDPFMKIALDGKTPQKARGNMD